MKFPVLGAELTMQERGTTLVEGPIRRTMEMVEMPAVAWRGVGGMSVYVGEGGGGGGGGGEVDRGGEWELD